MKGLHSNNKSTTNSHKQLNKMIKIAIIIGSTRHGRNYDAVAQWVNEIAKKRSDAEFELRTC